MKSFSDIKNSAVESAKKTGKKLRAFSKHQLTTMRSVEKLDDNVYLLDYKNDYHLPELLEKGFDIIDQSMTDFEAGKIGDEVLKHKAGW